MNFTYSRHIIVFFNYFQYPGWRILRLAQSKAHRKSSNTRTNSTTNQNVQVFFVYLCVHMYGKMIFQNSKYADLLESSKSHNGGLNVICYVICRLTASFSKVLSSFRMSGSCLVIKVCLLSKECLLNLIMLESLGKQTRKTAH